MIIKTFDINAPINDLFFDKTPQNEFRTKSCTQLIMQKCLILKFEILNGNFEPITYFQVVDNKTLGSSSFQFQDLS